MAIRTILLFGAGGQLGQELLMTLRLFAHVVPYRYHDADFTDPDQVVNAVRQTRPTIVVNAAAYTKVDDAEADPKPAYLINGYTVGTLGELAKKERFGLVHFSTDYVFDGKKKDIPETPLGAGYDEDDAPNPLNEYGRSKRQGEAYLLEMDAPAIILRTAWLYSTRHRCLLTKVLNLAREVDSFRMVADQIGSPTFARDLAEAVALMLYGMQADPLPMFERIKGLYHLAGTSMTSRAHFATTVLDLDPRRAEHRGRQIQPIATAADPRPAPRPLRTPLNSAKFRRTFGIELPSWYDALARALLTS